MGQYWRWAEVDHSFYSIRTFSSKSYLTPRFCKWATGVLEKMSASQSATACTNTSYIFCFHCLYNFITYYPTATSMPLLFLCRKILWCLLICRMGSDWHISEPYIRSQGCNRHRPPLELFLVSYLIMVLFSHTLSILRVLCIVMLYCLLYSPILLLHNGMSGRNKCRTSNLVYAYSYSINTIVCCPCSS